MMIEFKYPENLEVKTKPFFTETQYQHVICIILLDFVNQLPKF